MTDAEDVVTYPPLTPSEERIQKILDRYGRQDYLADEAKLTELYIRINTLAPFRSDGSPTRLRKVHVEGWLSGVFPKDPGMFLVMFRAMNVGATDLTIVADNLQSAYTGRKRRLAHNGVLAKARSEVRQQLRTDRTGRILQALQFTVGTSPVRSWVTEEVPRFVLATDGVSRPSVPDVATVVDPKQVRMLVSATSIRNGSVDDLRMLEHHLYAGSVDVRIFNDTLLSREALPPRSFDIASDRSSVRLFSTETPEEGVGDYGGRDVRWFEQAWRVPLAPAHVAEFVNGLLSAKFRYGAHLAAPKLNEGLA